MSFTVEQFEDLLRLLRERPDWRQRLLEALLTEELLKLPVEFRAFRAEALDRFDRVEARLSAVETRLEGIQARLSAVETRLEGVQARLSAVETRLEGVQARLSAVETRLGRLENVIGLEAEVAAADAVGYVLKLKGFKPLGDANYLQADGEIDLAWEFEGPGGERVWVVAEAKHRLKTEDVYRFAQRFRSRGFKERLRAAGIPGPYLAYVFGVVKELGAEERAAELGIGLITARGEVIAPRGVEL